MKHVLYFLFLLFTVLIMLSCNSSETVGPQSGSNVLMPLAVGNQWTYTDSTFYSTGVFYRLDSTCLKITGSSQIPFQGQTLDVYHWNWVDLRTGIPQDYRWLDRIESDGLYCYGGKTSKGTYIFSKSMNQKYPVTANESWKRISYIAYSDSTFKVGDTVTVTCLAVDADFFTSLGNMKSIVYYYRSGTIDTYLYYVPNIGYIGLINKQNGIMTFKKTVRAYKLVQ